MTNSLSNYSLKGGFDNAVPFRDPNPPDPALLYPPCCVCEEQGKWSEEDCVLVFETHKQQMWVCLDCQNVIHSEKRPILMNCSFCDDEFPVEYAKVSGKEIYICDDCMGKIY